MRPVWSVEEARAADARAQDTVSEAVLIERAAAAVATSAAGLMQGAYARRVVVAAGKGHNGADGLWAGVRLAERGAAVDVVLPLGEPADEHGARPLALLRGRGSRVVAPDAAEPLLTRADLVVDAVLGVGARSERHPWPGMHSAVGQHRSRVLAVDLPSGVDADTGRAGADVPRADVTVTFGALKTGLVVGAGKALAGLVVVADIGLAERTSGWSGYPDSYSTAMLDADDVDLVVPAPSADANKYTRGVVGVAAGSGDYPGAAVLACAGALACGAGMVRLLAPPSVQDLVRSRHPEVVGHPPPQSADDLPRVDTWVVGSGLGRGGAARELTELVLATGRPVVIDADGLHHAGAEAIKARSRPTLVTPHAGELGRLTGIGDGEITRDPVGTARRVAADLGCTVLLKGDATVVADPDGRARINPTGTASLASAGTGDVLAGMCGALWRRDLDTAAAASWLHGLAGRLAAGSPGAPLTASAVAAHVPAALRLVRGGAG